MTENIEINDQYWLDSFVSRNAQWDAVEYAFGKDKLPKDPEKYWNIIGALWSVSEFPSDNIETWLCLLRDGWTYQTSHTIRM